MRPLLAGAVGVVVGALITVGSLSFNEPNRADPTSRHRTYADLDHLDFDHALLGLYQGDGQAFAALAQDPLLRRPELFREGDAEAAYRAQRPLLGWLGWLASGGRPQAVPEAMFALTVLSYGAMAAAAARLAGPGAGRGALWVLALPGALVILTWAGPECLGTAAALLGLDAWRRRRPIPAAAALTAAALCRETLLLVAAVCALDALRRRQVRELAWAVVPALAYAAWVVVVHTRYGAWPSDAGEGRLSPPFVGMIRAAGGWNPTDWATAVAGAGAVGLALALHRGLLGAVAAAHLAFSLVMGELVWRRFEDFGRILLPMHAVAAVAIVSAVASRRAGAAGGGSSPPPRTRGPGRGSPAAVPAPPSS